MRSPVLVTGHGEEPSLLNAARRASAYKTLVLLSTEPGEAGLPKLMEHEKLAGVSVEVVPVQSADFGAALSAARAAIRRPGASVRVHVGGGSNLVATALLLAAFESGVEAFYCRRDGAAERLPVAVEVSLEDRVGAAERAVLLALSPVGDTELPAISTPGLTSAQVKGALLRLRKAGLVRADAARASLTATGASYRAHFGGS